MLLLLACIATSTTESAAPVDPFPVVPATGVVREYELTVTQGDYELLMMGGMPMGTLHGYLINGQFLAPTLVADLGDTLRVTLNNQVDVAVGLHPHGVRYDKANEGVDSVALPGQSLTYTWEANQGPGTFIFHSHEMNAEMIEYQGMAGVLGMIVVRDPAEEALYQPTTMINYMMMNTYEPWTEIDEGAMGEDSGDSGASTEVHNHTMVVQQVRAEQTDTQEDITADTTLGEVVRVNVAAFGEQFHTFHTHGFTWKDLGTGETRDVITLGPADSTHFYLKTDNPGTWMVHCHVDSHMHMMTTYLNVGG